MLEVHRSPFDLQPCILYSVKGEDRMVEALRHRVAMSKTLYGLLISLDKEIDCIRVCFLHPMEESRSEII